MEDCTVQSSFMWIVFICMAIVIYGMYEYTKNLRMELDYARPRKRYYQPTPKAKVEVLSTPCLPEDTCEYVGEHVDPGSYRD